MPILIPPDAAKRFCAVAHKCRPTRTRDPDLPVFAQARAGMLTLFANFGSVALAVSLPTTSRPSSAVLTIDQLQRADALGLLGSHEQRVPKLDIPEVPEQFAEASPGFLTVMHEAAKTAAREQVRYAVTRVQLRGKEGKVLATDGKQALIQSGIAFPFSDDVLVSAVPVFGVKDLASQQEVQIGKTDTHLVIKAGPFTVWLSIDCEGRFPDVEGAIPRSRLATTLEVESADGLIDAIGSLPEDDDDNQPVTLVMGQQLGVRAQSGESPPAEVMLPESTVTGPPMIAVVNRVHLMRALSLGFCQFRFVSPERPWVATDSTRTFLASSLDPKTAVVAAAELARSSNPASPPPIHEEDHSVANTNNGHSNGQTNGDRSAEGPDPFAEAEALKTALAEAHAQAGRLVVALRGYRKQRRTVESALASLRSLRLE